MTPPDASTHALPSPAARRSAARQKARPAANGLVAERLRARQHRVWQIRRRVAAIAATTFLATSGGVLVQLATGNDPALASAATKAAAVSTAAKSTAVTTAAKTTAASTAAKTTAASTAAKKTTAASTAAKKTTAASTSSSSSSGKTTAVTTSRS